MRLFKNSGLTLVLLMLFAGSIFGQWLAGRHFAMEDARGRGRPILSIPSYTERPGFLSSAFENWETEFLQMATYVIFTACLIQRGLAGSKKTDASTRDNDPEAQAGRRGMPAILRPRPIWLALYASSLGTALAALGEVRS